jgi:hypothetical protein
MMSAQVQFRAGAREDAAELSSFLQRVFQRPPHAALVDRRHLEWKYWSDREDWSGPRSFTARHDGTIVAHAAAWPVRFRLLDREVAGAHLIDWASDPRYPGAGTWLLRQVRAKAKLLIATGGTDITRRTLPVLGFRPSGEVRCFARPLRPFGQARTTSHKTWRLPGRFVRNSVWRWFPPASPPAGWSASIVGPEDVDESIWAAPSDAMAVTMRSPAFYRYWLASPSTRHVLFELRRRGEPAGYFCLAYARHVARIADLWVRSPDAGDWCAGARTAFAAAAPAKDVYEVTAWASTRLAADALTRAGFRLRDCWTLSVSGDAGSLAGRELHVQMLDCDASFLGADEVSYLT